MSRKILLQSLPTSEPNRFLDMELYYDKGGSLSVRTVNDGGVC